MFGWTEKKAIVHDLVLALAHDVGEILAQEAGSGAQQGRCDYFQISLMVEYGRICDCGLSFEEPPLALGLRFNLLRQGIAISAD